MSRSRLFARCLLAAATCFATGAALAQHAAGVPMHRTTARWASMPRRTSSGNQARLPAARREVRGARRRSGQGGAVHDAPPAARRLPHPAALAPEGRAHHGHLGRVQHRHGRQVRRRRRRATMPAGSYGYWPANMRHFVVGQGRDRSSNCTASAPGRSPTSIRPTTRAPSAERAQSGQSPAPNLGKPAEAPESGKAEPLGCRQRRRQLRTRGTAMPRYLVERTFPNGLTIPMTDDGKKAVASVIAKNAELGVTWIQSFVAARQQADLLHLRRPDAGIGAQGRRLQRAASGPRHRSDRPRSVLLSAVSHCPAARRGHAPLARRGRQPYEENRK